MDKKVQLTDFVLLFTILKKIYTRYSLMMRAEIRYASIEQYNARQKIENEHIKESFPYAVSKKVKELTK